ncbi:hypothetical protein LTR17_022692 [Elasticomyces elasticus]|nr:hypothetical protein LTR17_022692 [Elasticomyces elasticus]
MEADIRTHDDYTVAWICPIEVEQVAAMEMLDEEHPRLPQSHTNHNAYTLGSIYGHNVVIASLPMAGNAPAATVVAQMVNTFSHLRFGLLVGIGGGVPTRTDEGRLRLGHVVVSKPNGEHSGAVQYDRGKAEAGNFQRTGSLAPPPDVLLNAAQHMSAVRRRASHDPLLANLQRIDTSKRQLRRYRYPGVDQDRLYQPEYIHPDRAVSCRKRPCDPEKIIVHRSEDSEEEDDGHNGGALQHIVVHRGTIAVGELVMRDAVLRDQLAKEHNILCFEMEAAGALNSFPCLVVRGISDYSDSHKSNDWQGFAAATAAAYARELFQHMPVDKVKQLQQNNKAQSALPALGQHRQPASRSHVRDQPSREQKRRQPDDLMRDNMNMSIYHTDEEVNDLRNLLEGKFHFTVEPTLELANAKCSKPQHQLGTGIGEFIEKYDGQQRLLIVYYTGHGRWVRPDMESEGHLLLSAAQNSGLERDQGHSAVADWNTAEHSLMTHYVDADVCVILDCCFAANSVHKSSVSEPNVRNYQLPALAANSVHKSSVSEPNARKYQLLAPSGPDMLTSSNPSRSFSAALIASLGELCNKHGEPCFTLTRLSECINLKPYRRYEQSQVWNRLPVVGQDIRLAPLNRQMRNDAGRRPVQGHLTLRFAVGNRTVNKHQLDRLARRLAKCCEFDPMVRGIEWVGFEPVPDVIRSMLLVWHYYRKWRHICLAKRPIPTMREQTLTPEPPPPPSRSASVHPSTTRKRAHSPSQSPRLLPAEPSKRRAALHVGHEVYEESELEP